MKRFNPFLAVVCLIIPFVNTWYLYRTTKQFEVVGFKTKLNSTTMLILGIISSIITLGIGISYILSLGNILIFLLPLNFICFIFTIIWAYSITDLINYYYSTTGVKIHIKKQFIVITSIVIPLVSVILLWQITLGSLYVSQLNDYFSYLSFMTISLSYLLCFVVVLSSIVCGWMKFQSNINKMIDIIVIHNKNSHPNNTPMYNQQQNF